MGQGCHTLKSVFVKFGYYTNILYQTTIIYSVVNAYVCFSHLRVKQLGLNFYYLPCVIPFFAYYIVPSVIHASYAFPVASIY